VCRRAGLALAASLASACHTAPAVKEQPAPQSAPVATAAAPLPAAAEPPPRALADFDRAVGLMRAGNKAEAELEFQQLAAGYPAFAGPDINLGILYRKDGRLDESEQALKAATTRNAGSAAAWNELGVTLRLRGEFPAAAAAYEHAIAADANFAPAHRNLGVVLDLYLEDPERALTELERYQELSGEEKPVSVWIAELRQRTGKKKPASPPPPTPSGE
jgi:tetratricopeptide (TPR) repeat protein